MAKFQLLHVSDLHIKRDRSIGFIPVPSFFKPFTKPHDPVAITKLSEFVWANSAEIHAFVISGDIATTGKEEDQRLAWTVLFEYSDKPFAMDGNRSCNARLNNKRTQGKPVFIIPGNHDRFKQDLKPGNKVFDSVFDDEYKPRNSITAMRFDPEVPDNTVLFVLGVDFALDENDLGSGSPLPLYIGQGRAMDQKIAQLLTRTGEIRNACRQSGAQCAILWIMHFDPTCEDSSLELLERDKLAQALDPGSSAEAQLPDAIMCGHTHETKKRIIHGKDIFICGSSTQGKQNGLQFLCIDIPPDNTQPVKITAIPYHLNRKTGVWENIST